MALGLSTKYLLSPRLQQCYIGASQVSLRSLDNYQPQIVRSLFTSPTLNHPNKKRRKRYTFWNNDENLLVQNTGFLQGLVLSSRSMSTGPQEVVLSSSGGNLTECGVTTTIPIEDFLDVKVVQKEDVTYVDAEIIKTGREGKVIDVHSEACVLCRLNLKTLNYTDVMILSQFIKRDGTLATFHESKLCTKQYIRVRKLIKQAQRCNLISRPQDYLVPGPWHDLNTYIERDRKRDQPIKIVKKQYWKV